MSPDQYAEEILQFQNLADWEFLPVLRRSVRQNSIFVRQCERVIADSFEVLRRCDRNIARRALLR